MSESEQFYTASGPVSAEAVWRMAKADMGQQMTRSTFDTWLVDAELTSYADGLFTIGVKNSYAVDWLENRLRDMVLRSLTAVAGQRVNIRFVLRRQAQTAAAADPLELTSEETPPLFPGFEPFRTNFVQAPRQYFEIVLRDDNPVVAAFVGAVIAETVGVVVNNRTSERREWWEASYPEIGRATGIKSKASVIKAVHLAREKGYVIRAPGLTKLVFRYRLRDLGEPIDAP